MMRLPIEKVEPIFQALKQRHIAFVAGILVAIPLLIGTGTYFLSIGKTKNSNSNKVISVSPTPTVSETPTPTVFQNENTVNTPIPTQVKKSNIPTPTNKPAEPTATPTSIPTNTPVPTRTPNPPIISISFPEEMTNIEYNQSQTLCVVDIPAGGDTSGPQRKHNVNDGGWSSYVDMFTLCFEPKEGLNRFSVQYKNKYGEESAIYTRQFNFHRIQ